MHPAVWREVTVEGLWQLDMNGTSKSTTSPIPIPWLRPPPSPPVGSLAVPPASSSEEAASLLSAALEEAVRRRVAAAPPPQPPQPGKEEDGAAAARVGILYSGGLDCQVLAALAHRVVPAGQPIDLVSVCFDAAGGHRSPDRLGALAGVAELRQTCPGRPWRLLGVDVSYGEVVAVEGRVKRLIHPCATPMDFNIAASFFFAARGRGRWLATVQQDAGMGACSLDGAAAGLLRYGKRAEQGQAAAAPAAAVAAAADGGAGQCGSPVCRRVAKPGCRRGLCGHCCTRAQRRALEALIAAAESGGTEEEAAVAGGVLCSSHKLNKKYLPPALRPPPQRQQHSHPPAQPPTAAADATIPSSSSTQPHRSRARLLLLGIGADEQLAGYGRHRSTFARGGAEALERELALDLGRLWTRYVRGWGWRWGWHVCCCTCVRACLCFFRVLGVADPLLGAPPAPKTGVGGALMCDGGKVSRGPQSSDCNRDQFIKSSTSFSPLLWGDWMEALTCRLVHVPLFNPQRTHTVASIPNNPHAPFPFLHVHTRTATSAVTTAAWRSRGGRRDSRTSTRT